MDPKTDDYLWDNSAKAEVSQRFDSLEAMYDPATFRHLDALGITKGWNCLEVGGGGGSIARWLSNKVGPEGRVLVTDINPQFLTRLKSELGNVDILQHNITNESGLPKAEFDLAHARLVLIHVGERERALANMVSSVKPGGCVMVEDFDLEATIDILGVDFHPTKGVPPTMGTELMKKVKLATTALLEKHGADPSYARRLYRMMRSIGLVEVGISVEGARAWSGGSAGARLQMANSMQSKDEMIVSGILSEQEFADAIKMMEDPEWTTFSNLMVSAWGRKP